MINSLMQVRAGICATNRMAWPMSSACTINSRCAADGGTGRYASTLLDVASTLSEAELASTLRAEVLA